MFADIFTADFFRGLLLQILIWVVLLPLFSALFSRYLGSSEAQAPSGERAWSLECWTRLLNGEDSSLSPRWRAGRAVVSPGSIQLNYFRWGLRFRRLPPFVINVAAVDAHEVRPAGWRNVMRFGPSYRLVVVTTVAGSQVEVALPAAEVDVVLALLQGRSLPEPSDSPASPVGYFPRTVHVKSQALVRVGETDEEQDVLGQLSSCLADVEGQLAQEAMSLSNLVGVKVLTTDVHAAGAQIGALAARLRQAGAAPTISMLGVERLPIAGQMVELEATAVV